MSRIYLDLGRDTVRLVGEIAAESGMDRDDVFEAVLQAGLKHLPPELRGMETTRLGLVVRRLRTKHGLTRTELGAMWNTSHSQVKRVEDGVRVSPRLMYAVAAWLQVSFLKAMHWSTLSARMGDAVPDEDEIHPLVQRWLPLDYVAKRIHQAGNDRNRPKYVVVWADPTAAGGYQGCRTKEEAGQVLRRLLGQQKTGVVAIRYWSWRDPLVYEGEEEEEMVAAESVQGPGDAKVVVARVAELSAVSLEDIDPDSLDWDAPIDFDAVFGRVGHFETGEEWLASNLVASQLQPGHYYAVDLRDGRLVAKAAAVEELPVEAEGERRFVFYAEAAAVVEGVVASASVAEEEVSRG